MQPFPTDIIAAIISGIFTIITPFIVYWLNRKKGKSVGPKPQWRKRIVVILLMVVWSVSLVGFGASLNALLSPPEPLEIIIISPLPDALVTPETNVKGYATTELPENQHLYIVVEYGGRWWPQYSEVTVGYSSASKRYEFGTPARIGNETDFDKTFGIRAILVDSAVHQQFQNWFQTGAATGYQGCPITEVNQWGEVDMGKGNYITVKRQPLQ